MSFWLPFSSNPKDIRAGEHCEKHATLPDTAPRVTFPRPRISLSHLRENGWAAVSFSGLLPLLPIDLEPSLLCAVSRDANFLISSLPGGKVESCQYSSGPSRAYYSHPVSPQLVPLAPTASSFAPPLFSLCSYQSLRHSTPRCFTY